MGDHRRLFARRARGNIIEVAGTTAVDKSSNVVGIGDVYFRDIKPVTTMVEVKALIRPELLVEVEATAIVEE